MTIIRLVQLVTLLTTSVYGVMFPSAKYVDTSNNHAYHVYNELSTWPEAASICASLNMRLAEPSTSKSAQFLATNTASAQSSKHKAPKSYWLGGHRDSTVFEWMTSGPDFSKIPVEKPSSAISAGSYPFISNTGTPNDERDCLAGSRLKDGTPTLVPSKCSRSKPFICESVPDMPAASELIDVDLPLFAHQAQFMNKRYMIYHANHSWQAADTFCKDQGKRLAVLDKKERLVKLLARQMAEPYIAMDRLWVGARDEPKGTWSWSTNKTVDPKRLCDDINRPVPREDEKQCLLLDNTACKEPGYVSRSCEDKSGFVCEQYNNNKIEQLTIPCDDQMLEIFTNPMTWQMAKERCEEQPGRHLAKIKTDTCMSAMTQLMGELEETAGSVVANHVWIGGRLNKQHRWSWQNLKGVIPYPGNDDDVIRFVDSEINPMNGCLNIDRNNDGRAYAYGMPCNAYQSYVCSSTKEQGRKKSMPEVRKTVNNYRPRGPSQAQHLASHIKSEKKPPKKDLNLKKGIPELNEGIEYFNEPGDNEI